MFIISFRDAIITRNVGFICITSIFFSLTKIIHILFYYFIIVLGKRFYLIYLCYTNNNKVAEALAV